MTKDIRIEMKFRNNLILKRMEAAGHETMSSFCRAHPEVHLSSLCALVSMKWSPLCGSSGAPRPSCDRPGPLRPDKWRTQVIKIAAALDCTPEDLFSNDLLRKRDSNRAQIELEAADVAGLLEHTKRLTLPADARLEARELREQVERSLRMLTPREERVIKTRFGLGSEDEPQTLEQLANDSNVTRERIRQIESKALRKLRHPSRASELKPFLY